ELRPLRPITLTDQALTRGPVASESIAVGTVLTGGPPHRPERAELPHSVLALGVERQTAALGRDGSHGVEATICRPIGSCAPTSGWPSGYGAGAPFSQSRLTWSTNATRASLLPGTAK